MPINVLIEGKWHLLDNVIADLEDCLQCEVIIRRDGSRIGMEEDLNNMGKTKCRNLFCDFAEVNHHVSDDELKEAIMDKLNSLL
ncbi:MAG: hypothetical protein LBV74_01265 [Tannerella sp.]|jgi:hypothetical protein|nr:hypothetical protein [Tannerella sp.]